jgi:hypothetical protein
LRATPVIDRTGLEGLILTLLTGKQERELLISIQPFEVWPTAAVHKAAAQYGFGIKRQVNSLRQSAGVKAPGELHLKLDHLIQQRRQEVREAIEQRCRETMGYVCHHTLLPPTG